MPDLLLELFSEEIPARMQAQAAKDLERLIVGALSDRGLLFEGVKSFAGPRRLTLTLHGLPAKQPDVSEEKKGPRVGAPDKAIEGFLRSAGVTLEQCQKQADAKGEFYVAVIARKGRATAEVLAEIVPEAMAKLPWPKSMRWGTGGATRWVRPLHAILCTFDGEVVPLEFAGVKSGNTTRGHRFLSDGAPIRARHFEDYEAALRRAHVLLDAEERKDIILHEAKQKAFALGLELIEDEGLLNEVAGLAEWPVVLIGTIEDQFMDVPPEILQTSMRTHQKYFSLRDPKSGKMANRFAVVANMVAADGGKEIVAGNERVLRARLSDAKFFWDQDRKHTLESRVEALKNIVFHAKLGTQFQRVERIEALAGEIAAKIGADVEKAKRAARLCKADLTTGVVGEFPELQGVMGRYYALHDGEDAEVADAIRDHYKPLGPSDAVPTAPVSIAVALADKLDQLVSFFTADEKPTGSSDPFALRRAALGFIRIALDRNAKLSANEMVEITYRSLLVAAASENRLFRYDGKEPEDYDTRRQLIVTGLSSKRTADPKVKFFVKYGRFRDVYTGAEDEIQFEGQDVEGPVRWPQLWQLQVNVFSFLCDRLKVALREKGTRHDLIDAVFSLGNEDDLVRLVARVEALQTFLASDDGANLLTAYRRAANILKAEEKKDGRTYDGEPDREALELPEEKRLFADLAEASALIRAEVERERFVEAMSVMARLRNSVDAYFEKVTVNAPDVRLRRNRLLLLSRLRATLHLVADFSKIEG
ncbi:MAG: glycine--tRNA ligase subunit beta [Alphaproteobacteria bacterium]|nr:glycine--tRNA ligase subunit beta [Alphaproteobacteria bacterium]MDE2012613.1 glycine--tRNA ligase subunit beta [Alphaproteobacteria bacterium]MDE2073035.1 glycine--tRNA ligase subunit beta [Alphaproteobacteria bacterium]